ncbi:hypothetical protein GCM10017612_06540 [Novosphingobium resinovorum]|nr:hypothetical protein GCM10017612_06540 [Novosphingobium resinovorum]
MSGLTAAGELDALTPQKLTSRGTARRGGTYYAVTYAHNDFALAACQTGGGLPDPKDVAVAIEAKPQPTADILSDAAASDRYNSALEGWGERLHAAGMRLSRFYERTGLSGLHCGK